MDNDDPQIQIETVKLEFPCGIHCEIDVENVHQQNVGTQLDMNDTEMDAKPSFPLYNLYPMKIKEEVNDPDPPFFSLTSVVKSETGVGHLDTQYFDHSSMIQRNLKRELNDDEGNCQDPLYGADSVPLGETPQTLFQVLGQYTTAEVETGDESNCCRLCEQSYSGTGECEGVKTCEKCLKVASKSNEHDMGYIGDEIKRYKCETCGKYFTQNSSLTRHKMSHSGEKPFKCGACGKRFAHNGNLTTHKRSHSGEKPFKCGT